MSEQAEIETPKPPRKPRFQFSLKHLLAAPVMLALLFGTAAWIGLDMWVPIAASVFVAAVSLVMIGRMLLFPRRSARELAEQGTVLVVTGLILLYLMGLAQLMSELGAPRSRCACNLKQIGVALHNYHDVHGSFPPAYTADEDGRPMHSWRVLILPFMESEPLFRQYDFNEPWNGPSNRKLAETCHTPILARSTNHRP